MLFTIHHLPFANIMMSLYLFVIFFILISFRLLLFLLLLFLYILISAVCVIARPTNALINICKTYLFHFCSKWNWNMGVIQRSIHLWTILSNWNMRSANHIFHIVFSFWSDQTTYAMEQKEKKNSQISHRHCEKARNGKKKSLLHRVHNTHEKHQKPY